MIKLTTAAAIAAMLTSTTLAQAEENWTGFRLGVQVGRTEASALGASQTETSYGIHAGYDRDMGKGFILGAEIDYNTADFSGIDVDTTRLKLRAGYAFNKVMVYGLVGAVNMDFGPLSETGITFGLGASFQATDHIIISGEYTRDSVDFLGVDIDADTLSLRAAYKF